MRVAVLGATGRTGVPLVEQALERGHQVTALARSREKAERLLPVADERLTIVDGDAVDPAALDRLVAGADAVIDVTGPIKGGPGDLRRQVTGHLLPAMQGQGVDRLLLLTGAGVRVDGDQPKAIDRVIRGAMRILQSEILEDGQAAVAAVTASATDWTVVRVPRLIDAEPRGQLRVAANLGGDTGTSLARRDLAEFILDDLEQPTWSGQAPVVSW